MTTKECADILNALTLSLPAGEKHFTARFIRERVEEGKLVAVIYFPAEGTRARSRIDIAALDLCAYVRQHHPSLLVPLEQRLVA